MDLDELARSADNRACQASWLVSAGLTSTLPAAELVLGDHPPPPWVQAAR